MATICTQIEPTMGARLGPAKNLSGNDSGQQFFTGESLPAAWLAAVAAAEELEAELWLGLENPVRIA
jgi:hypothetical protein